MGKTRRIRKKNYNESRTLLLLGSNGIVEGESFQVCFGQSVVVGRSSSCDFSLKKCKKYKRKEKEESLNNKSFLKVSREHFRITYCHPNLVEIKDLSKNGTFVNRNRIDKIFITDLREKEYEISFGEGEVLILSNGKEE